MATPVFVKNPKDRKGPKIEQEVSQSVSNFFHRDSLRLWAAREAEKKAGVLHADRPYNEKFIQVKLNECNVQDSSQISTLLHYLHQMLTYDFGAHHMVPRDDVGVLHELCWHVTPHLNDEPSPSMGVLSADLVDDPDTISQASCF